MKTALLTAWLLRANRLSEQDDEVARGAIFLFISAKATATLEFVQQEWTNDGNFIGAGNERDPIIGLQEKGATFTIPKQSVRRRIRGIDTFQRASRWRVLFHAELVRAEVVGRARMKSLERHMNRRGIGRRIIMEAPLESDIKPLTESGIETQLECPIRRKNDYADEGRRR